jgi:uncharacterized protein (TIGR02001 family)
MRLPMSLDHRSGSHPFPINRGGLCRLVLLIAVSTASVAPAAQAQTGITVGVASEYSLRGLSLSDGRPVLQLRVDHDTNGGWYAGGFASNVALPASAARAAVIAYAGRARRLGATLSWDAGLSQAVFVGEGRLNYREFYAGLNGERCGARIAFSPDYYGAGRTAYIELNGAHPLGEGLSLVGHAGWLHWFRYDGGARSRLDLRAAIAAELGNASVQLGWQARQRDPALRVARAHALFASLSYGF